MNWWEDIDEEYMVKTTKLFRKQLKKIERDGRHDIEDMKEVVVTLAKGEQLDPSYCPHPLKGNLGGLMSCHIYPDWVMCYQYNNDEMILVLARTGNHSNGY